MSNDDSDMIWVGDLDGYINLSVINAANEREHEDETRQAEFDDIGEIALFNGKAISPYLLDRRGIDPSEWRWAIHQAKGALPASLSDQELEKAVVRTFMSMGRPYAIARYTKWEKVPYSSAQTASLPLGLNALLYQYLSGQGIKRPQQFSSLIRDALRNAVGLSQATAYSRTRIIQSLLYDVSQKSENHSGPEHLEREATRTMLSLARLHFSIAEIDFNSFTEIEKLTAIYQRDRKAGEVKSSQTQSMQYRYIKNWRIRHLRPLTDLFPFSIRHGLERGVLHNKKGSELSREISVNELALAHCGVLLMRKSARANTVLKK